MNSAYRIFSVLLLVILSLNTAKAQKELKTSSGQKFLLYSDDTYTLVNKNRDKIQNVVTDDETIDTNYDSSNLIIDEKENVELLLNQLQKDEIQRRIKLERDYNEKSIVASALNLAIKYENEVATYNKESEMAEISALIKREENYQKNFGKLIKKLRNIKKNGSPDVNADLNRIKNEANRNFGYDFEVVQMEYTSDVAAIITTKSKKRKAKKEKPRIGYQCNIIFDGEDQEKGEYRRTTSSERFFSFTNENMKSYFKEKNFLNAEASMSKIGKYYYLFLDVVLKSNEAYKSYGVIPKNEKIIFKMIDGTVIKGKTLTYVNSEVLPNNKESIYRAFYKIDKKDVKRLSQVEVDQVGIIWSTGYEEYNVYKIDLLKNQAKCLLN